MGIQVQPCCCGDVWITVVDNDASTEVAAAHIHKMDLDTGKVGPPVSYQRGPSRWYPTSTRKWRVDGKFYHLMHADGHNGKPEWGTLDPTTGVVTFIGQVFPPVTKSIPGIMTIGDAGTVTVGSGVRISSNPPLVWSSFLVDVNRITGAGTQFSDFASRTPNTTIGNEITGMDYDSDGVLQAFVGQRAFVQSFPTQPPSEKARLEWWRFNPLTGTGVLVREVTEFGPLALPAFGITPDVAYEYATGTWWAISQYNGFSGPHYIWRTTDPIGGTWQQLNPITGVVVASDYTVTSFFFG